MCTQFWSSFIADVTLIRYYIFHCHTIWFYRMPNEKIDGRHVDNNDDDYEPIENDSSDIQSSNFPNNSNAPNNCNKCKRMLCQNNIQTLGSYNEIDRVFSHSKLFNDDGGSTFVNKMGCMNEHLLSIERPEALSLTFR